MEPTRTWETPSPVSQMHPPLLPPWGTVAGRPLLWGLSDAPVQRLAAASGSGGSCPRAACQAHPAVPAEPLLPLNSCSPITQGHNSLCHVWACARTITPAYRRTPPVCHTYARGTTVHGVGSHCACRHTVRGAATITRCLGEGWRHPKAPTMVRTSPTATPSSVGGRAGAGAGGDGGAARLVPDAREMGEQQSQKARRKPKSGDGDVGVRGGAAASESVAQTNSKRGLVSERCQGGREEGLGHVEGWRAGCPSAASSGSERAEARGEKERRERGRGMGWKKNQWKQIIPRHIRIKKLPAKTQNNHMVSVGSDGQQQRREARGDTGCCPPCRLPGRSMQGWMGAGEGAVPLPWFPSEWLWGTGKAAEGEPGLLWPMKAVWCKAAKQGAQAAGEEGEAGPGSARCPPSACPCRLLGPKRACLHAGWKRGGGLRRAPLGIPQEAG